MQLRRSVLQDLTWLANPTPGGNARKSVLNKREKPLQKTVIIMSESNYSAAGKRLKFVKAERSSQLETERVSAETTRYINNNNTIHALC